MSNLNSVTTPSPPTSPPSAVVDAAKILHWTGWVGVWVQLGFAVVAGSFLTLAALSRDISENNANQSMTGLGIFLAGVGIVVLATCAFLSFRYTRFSRHLLNPRLAPPPRKEEAVKVFEIALIVSLAGVLIGLLGSEASVVVLLAKLMSQPQGAAVYEPTKIIRVLDVVIVLVNVSIAIAHFLGIGSSLWLLKYFTKLET